MLLKNFFKLGYGELGSRLPLIVLEISIARNLGPFLYGQWSLFYTIIQYGNFIHFGVVSSLARKEPSLIVKEAFETLKDLRSSSFGFQFLIAFFLFLFLLLLHYTDNSLFQDYQIGIVLLLLVTIFAQQINLTIQVSALNQYKFNLISRCRLIFAFSFLVLGLIACFTENPIEFLILSWSISILFSLVYFFSKEPSYFPKPKINFPLIKLLLYDGSPIFFQGILRLGMTNIDRLILWYFSDSESVGIYSIGMFAGSLIYMVSTLVGKVSLPDLLRKKEIATLDILKNSTKSTFKLSVFIGSSLFLIIVFCSPIVIIFFMEQYKKAIFPIFLLSSSSIFLSQSQLASEVLLSFGIKTKVVFASILSLIISVFLTSLVYLAYEDISAVAFIILLINVFYFIYLIFLTNRFLRFSKKESFIHSFSQFFKIFLIIIVGFVLNRFSLHICNLIL